MTRVARAFTTSRFGPGRGVLATGRATEAPLRPRRGGLVYFLPFLGSHAARRLASRRGGERRSGRGAASQCAEATSALPLPLSACALALAWACSCGVGEDKGLQRWWWSGGGGVEEGHKEGGRASGGLEA